MAKHLGMKDPDRYSFHSFRRSGPGAIAAAMAAGSGSVSGDVAAAAVQGGSSSVTADQMSCFFGWSTQNMPTVGYLPMPMSNSSANATIQNSDVSSDLEEELDQDDSNLPDDVEFSTDDVVIHPNYKTETADGDMNILDD